MDANRSFARRRPSTANDHTVNPTTNSSAAIQNAVPHPVQDSSHRRPRATATPPAPAAYGAHVGNLTPTNEETGAVLRRPLSGAGTWMVGVVEFPWSLMR